MKKNMGHILAFIAIFVWGITFISTKILLKGLDPAEILFFRFLIAYIILFIIYPKQIKFNAFKTELAFLALGLTGVSLYFLAENVALQYTLASNVSLILSSAPILTALLAHFMTHDEKLKPALVIGFLVAFVGVFLVIFNGNVILDLNPLGDFLALLASLAWAFYSILLKRIKKNHPSFNSIYIVRRTFFYGLLSCIPILIIMNCDMKFNGNINTITIANILFLGLIASALCFVMWNKSVELIGVIKSSHYIYFIPLITMVVSAIVLKETVNYLMIAGCILILAGVYISEKA